MLLETLLREHTLLPRYAGRCSISNVNSWAQIRMWSPSDRVAAQVDFERQKESRVSGND